MSTDTNEKVYNPADVANLLNIKESTLRKYCLLLEKADYIFHKNERGQRGYLDSDIIVLRRLIDLKNSDMSLERACYVVVTWAKDHNITERDMELQRYDDKHDQEIKELKDLVQQQNELIKGLYDRLDQQASYIEKRLNEHDNALVESLRQTLEVKKQIAAAEEKKGFFSRLFNK